MQLEKKYVQFNSLVIDNYDMLSSASLSAGFKTNAQEYSYGHGSYAPFKRRQQFSEAQSLSMTLHVDQRKLQKQDRSLYKDFMVHQLVSYGKLWAVEGETLLWTNAYVDSISEPYNMIKGSLSIDVEFVIYEGFWRKADVRKTFLQPYQVCEFADFFYLEHPEKCNECCDDCKLKIRRNCPACIANCEYLTKEYSLCNMEINFDTCDTYFIHHNCTAGKRIWKEEELWGHKICKKHADQYEILGNFYSHTVLDTELVTVRLDGTFIDPVVTINNVSLKILGEYSGLLTIMDNWQVFYLPEGFCEEAIQIDVGRIVINNEIGFLVQYGKNKVHVEGASCCGYSCIYILEEQITI